MRDRLVVWAWAVDHCPRPINQTSIEAINKPCSHITVARHGPTFTINLLSYFIFIL